MRARKFQKGSKEPSDRGLSKSSMLLPDSFTGEYARIVWSAEKRMGQHLPPTDTQKVLEYSKLKNRLVGNREEELPGLFLSELQDVLLLRDLNARKRLQNGLNDLQKGSRHGED